MKIKVETLAEVILKELSGDVEYERWFGRILPFLKKISELEEKNEALEEKTKELEKFKGTDSINEVLRRENSNLLEKIHDLETKIDFINKEIITLRVEKANIEIQCAQLQKENERKDNIIKSMEKNSTDLLMSNEELREKISKLEDTNRKLEDTNRKLSGELLNQTEEIHMFEEEIDSLKSEIDSLKSENEEVKEYEAE